MATPADIAAELGRPTPLAADVEAQWQRWIDKALYLIGKAATAAGVEFASLDADDVEHVVVESVVAYARAWRPDAVSRYSVQVDDGQTDRTYFKDVGAFTIAADLMSGLFPSAASGAFTVTPYFEPDPSPLESWA